MKVLDYEEVKKLFEKKCKHIDAYKNENIAFKWNRCKDCDLSNELFHESRWLPPEFSIDGNDKGTRARTLCFAIWHEDYLNDVIHSIQTDIVPLGWQTILVHKGIAYMPLIEVQRVVRDLKDRIYDA